MKGPFDKIISESVKPFLKNNGFKKKGLNFYKSLEPLIFLINFQKSYGNSSEETRFYINCSIHSSEIDDIQGKPKLVEPKEYETFYRNRISEITDTQRLYYVLNKDTDLEKLNAEILSDLKIAITFFDPIRSTNDLINLMLEQKGLNKYEELVTYMLVKGRESDMVEYINNLYRKHGSEDRWKLFENKINTILTRHSSLKTVVDLLYKY